MKKRGLFRCLFFVLCVCISQNATAQPTENVKINKSAKKLYKLGKSAVESKDYFLAKAYWDALKTKGFENEQQQYDYADLLQLLGDYEGAALELDSLEKKHCSIPLLPYLHGNLCLNMQQENNAKDYFKFFLKKRENRTQFPAEYKHATELVKYLDSLAVRMDTIAFAVYNLPQNINHAAAEFSPVITQNGLIYGSQELPQIAYYNTKKLAKGAVAPLRKLYLAMGKGMNLDSPQLFDIQMKNREVSSICFDGTMRTAYLSACGFDTKTEKYICHIYRSKKKANPTKEESQWTEPELVVELYDEHISQTQLSLGFDASKNASVLYFASDNPEGRGGWDIWQSVLNAKSKRFSPPKNCGSKINTPKDEITPFFQNANSTLYFSSNGRGGYGGYDIYGAPLVNGTYGEIFQLPKELNSPQDDIFFAPNRSLTSGYLVSNRYSVNSLLNPHCCDDIYYFDQNTQSEEKAKLKLNTTDKKNNPVPSFDYKLSLIDSNQVKIPIESAQGVDSATIENLVPKSRYLLEVSAKSFYSQKKIVDIPLDTIKEVDIVLDSIDYRPILLPLVEFDFDSFSLNATARHIIDSLAYPVLAENPEIMVELSAHTDSKGTEEYNEILSQKRAESIRKYLVVFRNISPKRLTAKGYGEYVPIASNENEDGTDNPEGRQRNRRCEFRILETTYQEE